MPACKHLPKKQMHRWQGTERDRAATSHLARRPTAILSANLPKIFHSAGRVEEPKANVLSHNGATNPGSQCAGYAVI